MSRILLGDWVYYKVYSPSLNHMLVLRGTVVGITEKGFRVRSSSGLFTDEVLCEDVELDPEQHQVIAD